MREIAASKVTVRQMIVKLMFQIYEELWSVTN